MLKLLQLRVFPLRLHEDRDVGVGIFHRVRKFW